MISKLFLLLVIAFLIYLAREYVSSRSKEKDKGEIGGAFVKKPSFFTHSERAFFEELERQNAGTFLIFSKVRLEDVVSVRSDIAGRERKIKRNYIKSKHIDFLIVGRKSGTILSAIELDGFSHRRSLQKKYDEIKERILKEAGVDFHRVHIGENFSERVRDIYLSLLK